MKRIDRKTDVKALSELRALLTETELQFDIFLH